MLGSRALSLAGEEVKSRRDLCGFAATGGRQEEPIHTSMKGRRKEKGTSENPHCSLRCLTVALLQEKKQFAGCEREKQAVSGALRKLWVLLNLLLSALQDCRHRPIFSADLCCFEILQVPWSGTQRLPARIQQSTTQTGFIPQQLCVMRNVTVQEVRRWLSALWSNLGL